MYARHRDGERARDGPQANAGAFVTWNFLANSVAGTAGSAFSHSGAAKTRQIDLEVASRRLRFPISCCEMSIDPIHSWASTNVMSILARLSHVRRGSARSHSGPLPAAMWRPIRRYCRRTIGGRDFFRLREQASGIPSRRPRALETPRHVSARPACTAPAFVSVAECGGMSDWNAVDGH